MSDDNLATTMAKMMADMADLWAPVQEATMGYRNKLVEMGMSKEQADRCAADYHSYLFNLMPTGKKGFGMGGKG